ADLGGSWHTLQPVADVAGARVSIQLPPTYEGHHMRKLVLATVAVCALAAPAKANTIDPLHGYAVINGQNVNTDTGAVSPISLGSPGVSGFGFFASPAPLTDDLNLVVLEPNTVGNQVPVSVTGNVGGGTLFTHVGTFSSGDLATLLGFTNSSPANMFQGF